MGALLLSGASLARGKQACQDECDADVKECIAICLKPEEKPDDASEEKPDGKRNGKSRKGNEAQVDKHKDSHGKIKPTPAICKKTCTDMAAECKKDCE